MCLRETRRTNRDGSVVSYLQLAHNERHPGTGTPVAKVIHNFGRADTVDREALARLVSSISRFLTPEQAVAAAHDVEVEVLDSRRVGGAWTLDRLWERLGIGAAIRRVAKRRRLDGEAVERVIFALVAQRALEPGSKLAATGWVGQRVAIEGCEGFSDDQAYRAMDFLLAALDEIASEVFASVAHLLNLDLDIVFVDTTSTYWETEGADQLADLADNVDDDGLSRPVEQAKRTFGHSKDFRTDLPQVVIAMAVTRDGTPIRCWTCPGNENDTAIIRTVKDDLAGWNLHRMVWVADRGFASAANRAYLTRGGGHYIHAEKLRHTNTEAAAALARPGRYASVAGNLRVKEIHVAPGGKGDGDHGVVLGVPEGDCRGGLAAADGADSVPVSPVDRDGRGVVVQLGCVHGELTDRAEHDRGQQAGPVGVEQRLQGPPDPVVVEPVDLGLGQPQQARVVAGGPLAQAIQGLSLIHISEPTRRTPISYAVFC